MLTSIIYGTPVTSLETPSGAIVELTPEEQVQSAKNALLTSEMDRIRFKTGIRRILLQQSINAVGTAIGFALGGALIAWFTTRVVKRIGR